LAAWGPAACARSLPAAAQGTFAHPVGVLSRLSTAKGPNLQSNLRARDGRPCRSRARSVHAKLETNEQRFQSMRTNEHRGQAKVARNAPRKGATLGSALDDALALYGGS
jgi:hypothetical protein